MKNALLLIALLPSIAQAESWFQFEAGLGVAKSIDMGDGIWIQKGAPNNRERLTTPAFLAGFTGDITDHLAWHADYVYFGTVSASVDGVPDDDYDPQTHRVTHVPPRYSPFNGQGHTQGVALTLEPYITYGGWRFGVEAGAWLHWETWHESLYALDNQWHDLSHKTEMRVSFVGGASISRNDFSLSYRYYKSAGDGNPYPGLVTGTHMLMFTKKF